MKMPDLKDGRFDRMLVASAAASMGSAGLLSLAIPALTDLSLKQPTLALVMAVSTFFVLVTLIPAGAAFFVLLTEEAQKGETHGHS